MFVFVYGGGGSVFVCVCCFACACVCICLDWGGNRANKWGRLEDKYCFRFGGMYVYVCGVR